MGKYTYKHLGHKLFQTPGVVDESKIVEVTLDPVRVTAKAMDRARKARESKPVKKAMGGDLLGSRDKADLNKDGKLSSYEKTRGMAIRKAMNKRGAKKGKNNGKF